MAKKKRAGEEEEDDVFVPPEFSEREYIEKDLRDSKILIITTIWGLIAGLSAAAATIFINSTPVGFLLVIVFVVALFKLLYRLIGVDISRFKRSDYLIKGATVLLTALAIWILLVNPPFYVMAPPSVRSITLTEKTASGWQSYPANGSSAIPAGEVNITAVILHDGTITAWISITNSSGTVSHLMNYKGGSTYDYLQHFSPGSFSLVIVTKLPNGTKTYSPSYPVTIS